MSRASGRGFTIGGVVILALIMIVIAITTYLLSDYLYTMYEAGRYTAEIGSELASLGRSCTVYVSNGSLYFPYGTYIEYSVPNVTKPGWYREVSLSGINGTVLLFTRGCVVLVEPTGNATGFEVIGYGAG